MHVIMLHSHLAMYIKILGIGKVLLLQIYWNKLVQIRKDIKYKNAYGSIIYQRKWLQTK